MASKLEILETTLEQGFPLDEDVPSALADPARVAGLRAELEAIVADDFVVEMIGDEDFRITRHGIDGFEEAWRDWSGAFERFRVGLDDVIESGDHLVTLVRQIGLPRGGTTEIETEAAAVWTFEGEKITRVEFHLDRAAALRSAGAGPE